VSSRNFFRAHLKFFAGVILLALAGASAVGGALFYRHQTGSGRAFQMLQEALNMGDKVGLATLADFRTLSEDFVQAVLAVYPQAETDEMQQAEMRDEVQRQVLKAFDAKKSTKSEGAKPRKIFTSVPVVPEDVVAQIAAGLKLEAAPEDLVAHLPARLKPEAPPVDLIAQIMAGLKREAAPQDVLVQVAAGLKDNIVRFVVGLTREATPDGMQIRTQFAHRELQTEFSLRLLMERRQSGWRVTRLLNAQELVKQYKGAVDSVRAGDEAKRTGENDTIIARMRAHFHEPKCLAAVNMLSNKHEAMLVVKVTADNTESTTLHHVNLLCDVRAGNGRLLYSRQLNVVQRVVGGGSFSNTWTVVLDAKSEDAVRLLQAGPLSCTVEPKTLSVGVGEVLYQRGFE